MLNIRPFGGNTPSIHHGAWIDPSALVIGDVSVGAHSSIWPMAVIRGDVQRIRIGNGSNIQDGAVLHVSHDSHYCPGGLPLHIGDGVTVGHQATLHACEVHDHCLIGIGARVLDGAVLEEYSLLGAGALVPPGKRLEGGYLWIGSPVRKLRALDEQDKERLEYSARHYTKLAEAHRLSLLNEDLRTKHTDAL